jgi:hypothetical protein
MEDFFHEYAKLIDAAADQVQQIYQTHGMEVLGPPLDVGAMLKFFEGGVENPAQR